MGVQAGLGGSVLFSVMVMCSRMIIFLADPAVPGLFSNNPICPTVGVPRTFNSLTFLHLGVILDLIFWSMVQALRPQRFWACFVCTLVIPFVFNGAISSEFGLTCIIMFFLFFGLMYVLARRKAQDCMDLDNKKYEEKWKESVQTLEQSTSAAKELMNIEERCKEAHGKIKPESYATHKISSTDLKTVFSAGLLRKLLYWIGGAGLGRFSRKGKIRQVTEDIDDLFAEVCIFFSTKILYLFFNQDSSVICFAISMKLLLLMIFVPFAGRCRECCVCHPLGNRSRQKALGVQWRSRTGSYQANRASSTGACCGLAPGVLSTYPIRVCSYACVCTRAYVANTQSALKAASYTRARGGRHMIDAVCMPLPTSSIMYIYYMPLHGV